MASTTVHGVAATTEETAANETIATAAAATQIAFFAAANDPAINLLDLVQINSSAPALIDGEEDFGYSLSLPLSPGIGRHTNNIKEWPIGAGSSPYLMSKGQIGGDPEILLCPSGTSRSSRAAHRIFKRLHANFYLHLHSGMMMFRSLTSRTIIYEKGNLDGTDLLLVHSPGRIDSCVLWKKENFLRFGDNSEYRFVLKRSNGSNTLNRLRSWLDATYLRQSTFYGLPPSRLLRLSPRPVLTNSGYLLLRQPIPGTTLICGANVYTGQPLAVGMVQYSPESRQDTLYRLDMAKMSGTGLLPVKAVWCDHSPSYPCIWNGHGGSAARGCWFISYSLPLAEHSFSTMDWSHMKVSTRLRYFYETLSGLSQLHQEGFVHTSIHPDSLLIVPNKEQQYQSRADSGSLSGNMGREAVLLPCLEGAKERNDHISVAPEVWQDFDSIRTPQADIWALAASWLVGIVHAPLKGCFKITESDHQAMQRSLREQRRIGKLSEPLETLVLQMLAWDPRDRPTADEALASEAWLPVLEEKQRAEDSRKRKRQERMQLAADGEKRVRVISPEVDAQE
ncbi:hypothetical protein HDV63DRAFT_396526 [Trichoderma sp. SZMC 28014]